MNKKLLALAIAAALAPAAAMADSGNVKISGYLNMSVDSLNGGKDATGEMYRATNVSSNSSYIRFEGDEALGNGLKAIWQVTSYIGMGNTSQNTYGTLNSLANGNSFLGLSGGFGTAIMGRHDTPMKIIGRKVDLFGDQIGDSRNFIGGGTVIGSTGAFNKGGIGDLRPDNVIAYISPTVAGFHGAIAHVTNVSDDSLVNPTTGKNDNKALSALGMYESGPVMVAIAYEKHSLDASVAPADPKQWRLVGGYNFGDVKVTALYQKASDLQGVTNNDRKTWGLGGAYNMGASTIKAQYYKAGELNNVANTDSSMIALGYDYAMSKRTTAYAAYAKVNNSAAANYGPFGGGHGDDSNSGTLGTGLTNGKDPSGFSIGMKHSF